MPRQVYENSGFKMIDFNTIHFIDVCGEVIKAYYRQSYNNSIVWMNLITQVKDYPLGKEIVYINLCDRVKVNEIIYGYLKLDDLIEI